MHQGLLPGFFKTLNRNQIPIWGTLITGATAAIIAFLFDLGSLADMISIGTLMAFTIVCASVLVLRYQTKKEPMKVPMIIVFFVLDSFLFAAAYKYDFPYWALGVSGAPLLFTFGYICFLPTIDVPETFK